MRNGEAVVVRFGVWKGSKLLQQWLGLLDTLGHTEGFAVGRRADGGPQERERARGVHLPLCREEACDNAVVGPIAHDKLTLAWVELQPIWRAASPSRKARSRLRGVARAACKAGCRARAKSKGPRRPRKRDTCRQTGDGCGAHRSILPRQRGPASATAPGSPINGVKRMSEVDLQDDIQKQIPSCWAPVPDSMDGCVAAQRNSDPDLQGPQEGLGFLLVGLAQSPQASAR